MTYCAVRINNNLICHSLMCKFNSKWQASLTPRVSPAYFTIIKYDYLLLLCRYLDNEQFFKSVKFYDSVVIISEVISKTVMSSNFLNTLYKARFIANTSSCTTTELSKLLTFCLTAVKTYIIRYCEKVYERSSKLFGRLNVY